MIKYSKDLFGKDWKITVDTFSYQATKTQIILKIGNTIIEKRVFDIPISQTNSISSFIKMNEEELIQKAEKIISTYRIFYYMIRYSSFAVSFFKKQLNKYFPFYE